MLATDARQHDLTIWKPREGTYSATTNGSATIATDTGLNSKGMDFGESRGWLLTAPSGRNSDGTLNSVVFRTSFYGDALGLHLYRRIGTSAVDQCPLNVLVDRTPYFVDQQRPRTSDGSVIYNDGAGLCEVDYDLKPTADGRAHMLEIALFGNPDSSAGSRIVFLAGLQVDKTRAAYPDPQRFQEIWTEDTITSTSYTAIKLISSSQNSSEQVVRGISKITYQNVTANPATVTLGWQVTGGSTSDGASFVLPAQGTDGSYKEVNYNPPLVPPANVASGGRFMHKVAGTSPSVVCTVHGVGF
jgi:hypothetical protein